jgi:uncharacterized membrane protein YcaP (DUF421 family)
VIAHHLFTVGVPLLEKVLRTVAVYGGLAVLLRLAGKRDLAQLNSFDLVVMLLLSNVVQNAVIGPDDSLTGGLLGAAVLLAVNALIVRCASYSRRFAMLFEGSPTLLVQDGEIRRDALRHEGLREADVVAALRRQGASDIGEVGEATLQSGGAIVVVLRPDSQDATKGDLAALEARLMAALERR